MIDVLDLTSDVPSLAVPDGDHVVRAGERTGALFVLVTGRLDVRRDGRTVAQLAEPGSIVGEMGLLLDGPATADVVAVGDVEVRRVDDAERWFEHHPDLARHLAVVLARRLQRVTGYLADLERQYADRSDTLGLVPTVLDDLLTSGDGPPPDPGSDREPDAPY